MSDDRKPIQEVLPGMSLHPLGPSETAIEAFVLIKVRAADGEDTWSFRTSNALNRQELLGALIIQAKVLERDLVDEWVLDDEDQGES